MRIPDKHQLRIDILGTSFAIQSEEKPEYLKAIYDYLKMKIGETKIGSQGTDPLKISILTCLNCIDELFKERERSYRINHPNAQFPAIPAIGENNKEIDEVAARIIKKIDESLGGE
jgi:cell division protein ZapA (FtsZ GTPase activity inhibitor)